MEEQEITCIICPVGCRMQARVEDGALTNLTGNACKRGEVYAKQECLMPERMVTAVAPVAGSLVPVSLKTERPVPKDRIADCMREIAALRLRLPILMGDVLLEDVAGTGVRLLATRSLV